MAGEIRASRKRFTAMQATRQRILEILKERGAATVEQLATELELTPVTIRHHLDILRRAGLVESQKEERYIYYSVQRERVTSLVRLLTACC